ncbi:MAG: tetrahydrofolate synthase [Treponema sp.]|jgi:dihydrofolate synthase/folylpolyglutamate synthase|nr:tetrahydrofolate synthase [Treponema sp.]
MIPTIDDLAAWLEQFENNERLPAFKPFNLDKMRIISRIAGHPETCAPVIHVAGSKGKGSVTAMIASILEAAGIKTGRYTSPRLCSYWDRISLGNGLFPAGIYVEAGRELAETEERRLLEFSKGGDNKPSLFEMFTLLFFLCSRRSRCEAMAVETGLGGLNDATNIVKSEVSVITLIEKEHTEILGNTIPAIAAQKAGIIKAGKPLVLSRQEGAALEVFRKAAAEKKAPLYYLPETVAVENIAVSKEGTAFSLRPTGIAGLKKRLDLFIPVPGAVQAENAALAVIGVKTAFPAIGEDSIRRGLSAVSLPARFERLSSNPAIVIDGAHTPRSVETCVNTFISLYGKGGILIFGCAAGKDGESIAKLLTPHFSQIIITAPGTYKVSYPEEVYRIFLAAVKGPPPRNSCHSVLPAGEKVLLIRDAKTALEEALSRSREQGLPVLGTGSFYLAAEIRGIYTGMTGQKE